MFSHPMQQQSLVHVRAAAKHSQYPLRHRDLTQLQPLITAGFCAGNAWSHNSLLWFKFELRTFESAQLVLPKTQGQLLNQLSHKGLYLLVLESVRVLEAAQVAALAHFARILLSVAALDARAAVTEAPCRSEAESYTSVLRCDRKVCVKASDCAIAGPAPARLACARALLQGMPHTRRQQHAGP